jgi:hypothetical protein
MMNEGLPAFDAQSSRLSGIRQVSSPEAQLIERLFARYLKDLWTKVS